MITNLHHLPASFSFHNLRKYSIVIQQSIGYDEVVIFSSGAVEIGRKAAAISKVWSIVWSQLCMYIALSLSDVCR